MVWLGTSTNFLHNKWLDSEQNIHFHMNMDCVVTASKHDSMAVEKMRTKLSPTALYCTDMVWWGTSTSKWLDSEQNIYFHMNMDCV